MGRRAFAPEQIINKLREAEVHLSQGDTIGEASRKIEVTEQTYYRWHIEYGASYSLMIARKEPFVSRYHATGIASSSSGSGG